MLAWSIARDQETGRISFVRDFGGRGRGKQSNKYLIGSFLNSDRACDFCRSSTIYNAVVLDEIADDTESIVEGTFCFVDYLNIYISIL